MTMFTGNLCTMGVKRRHDLGRMAGAYITLYGALLLTKKGARQAHRRRAT